MQEFRNIINYYWDIEFAIRIILLHVIELLSYYSPHDTRFFKLSEAHMRNIEA
jgi:hypothetical protein